MAESDSEYHDSSSSSSSPEHTSEDVPPTTNVFANDGSFLEMFKKYQQHQEKQNVEETKKEGNQDKVKLPTVAPNASAGTSNTTPGLPIVAKRRGCKILPTGKVKKVKNEDDANIEGDVKPKDAWSVYMSEVKRYRETVCQGDDKTRPLVK